jgi:hypothetical protein
VVGGVEATGPVRVARSALVLDLADRTWSEVPGPETPRLLLGVTALAGRVYAVGGRTAGPDTNTALADAYDPAARRWQRLPDAPTRRAGGAATVADADVIAGGGEGPNGTIGLVDAFDPRSDRWSTLPRSPRARHGAALVGLGRRVYQAMGGPVPGFSASRTLLVLRIPPP